MWTTRTLGEISDEVDGVIQTGPFGSQLHESDYVEDGIPVVMPKNILDGKVDTSDIAFIKEEDAERLQRHKMSVGDIVYGRRGDIGRRGLIGAREHGWLCGTGCLRVSLGDRVLNPTYLYYYLGQPSVVSWIANQAVGATMPNLNTGILRSVVIQYPRLPVQTRIAAILSTYDDLIENNTRRIRVLEDMAQMIYREWFVNFRFPGHEKVRMVESDLGPIPQGWNVRRVEDFGAVVTGKTPSTERPDFYGVDVPFIKTPDMHGNLFCVSVTDHLSTTGAESQKNKTLPANSIMVNCIGALAGSVSISTRPAQTNQQINSVILNNQTDREFLYVSLTALRERLRQIGSNGATMINVNKRKFEGLAIVKPPAKLASSFHELTFAMFEAVRNFQTRIINLRTTRDFLLPKLISGEVPVEAVDDAAAERMEQTA